MKSRTDSTFLPAFTLILIIFFQICPTQESFHNFNSRQCSLQNVDKIFCTASNNGTRHLQQGGDGCDPMSHLTLQKCIELLGSPEHFFTRESSAFIIFFDDDDDPNQLMDTVMKMAQIHDLWRIQQIKHLLWLPFIIIFVTSAYPEAVTSSLVLMDQNFRENFQKLPLDSLIFIFGRQLEQSEFWFWEINQNNFLGMKNQFRINSKFLDYDDFNWADLGAIAGRRKFQKYPLKTSGIVNTLSGKRWHNLSFQRINDTSVQFDGGYSAELLWLFQDALDFTIDGIYSDSFILPHVNDGVNGVGKQIMDGDVDLCISMHTFQPYRSTYLNFLQPLYPENVHVYFRPPPKSAVRNMFNLPFSRQLWFVMGMAFMVIFLAFGFIEWVSWSMAVFQNDEPFYKKLDDLILWTVAASCLQSMAQVGFWTLSRRLIFASAICLATILNIFYTGSIASALMLDVAPLQTFQQLAKYGYLLLANEFNRIFLTFSMANSSNAFKAVEEGNRHFVNDVDSIRKALDEKNALYAAVSSNDIFDSLIRQLNYSNEKVCQLSKIRFGGSRDNVAMMTQKGSHYKEFLSVKTVLLMERGLNFVQKSRYHQNIMPACQPQSEKVVGYEVLGLSDILLALKIVGVGFSVAVAVFIFEVIMLKAKGPVDKSKTRSRDYVCEHRSD